MTDDRPATHYARIGRRIRAALFDALLIALVFYSFAIALSELNFPGIYKAVLVVLIILALEPGLVSTTGGTIGHHLFGMRIQNKQNGSRLSLPIALVRFLIKFLAGWLSFIFILTTQKHQALHDLASNSVVVPKNIRINGKSTGILERNLSNSNVRKCSWYRRLIIIFLYWLGLFSVLVVAFVVMLSTECFYEQRCSFQERMIETVSSILFFGGVIVSLVLGWNGRLFGARNVPISN